MTKSIETDNTNEINAINDMNENTDSYEYVIIPQFAFRDPQCLEPPHWQLCIGRYHSPWRDML